jgi:two-component system LytT family response regulator
MPIRTYITDDDPLSIAILCDLLEDYFPQVEVVGVGETVAGSRAFLQHHPVDLLFLDVELPDGSGSDLLDGSGESKIYVIMITSHAEYSLRPVPANLVDMIIKPVTHASLSAAMTRYGLAAARV